MTTHMPSPLTRDNRRQSARARRDGHPRRKTTLPATRPFPTPDQPSATSSRTRLALGIVLLACGIWSFWPTMAVLATTWSRVDDYAHGFLVVPIALLMLWVYSDRFPGLRETSPWLSLGLLMLSLTLRHLGDAFYFTFMDGWSIVLWTAAVVALVGGRPLLAWSWTSIVFLIFMVPLPFAIESDLSGPLQRIATVMSTATLQFLGQPAFAEGNVILLGNDRLEVAQACSGLRLFTSVLALTFALVAILRRPWWENAVLIVAAAPVAIVANAARIVATGLLFQQTASPQARESIHDWLGKGMIPLAALLFFLLLGYLRLLVKEEEDMDMTAVLKQCRTL